MAKWFFDVNQGSLEWHKLRSGIPTASCFDQIITPAKMELSAARKKYACRLIAERILNWQADSLEAIKHIADGKENEPLAVERFEFVEDVKTLPVGFVKTDDERFGASPDRIIGAPGAVEKVVECKAPTIPIQMERIIFGNGEAYKCQIQGQLYIAEVDEGIYYSFHPRMPAVSIKTHRDEAFIRKLRDRLDQFSDELEEWTEIAKRAGAFEAFAEMVSAVDAEHGDNIRRDPLTTEAEMAALIERDMLPGELHRAGA